MSFSTTYSNQYKVVNKLLTRHWDILQNDEFLELVLPDHPKVIFKKVSGLRHPIALNVVEQPVRPTFFGNLKGFFPCRRCPVCKCCGSNSIRTQTFSSTTTGKTYRIDSFITCTTKNVVYLLQRNCEMQYVGRTKRALHVRIEERLANIKKGFPKLCLSRHFPIKHGKDPSQVKVIGI